MQSGLHVIFLQVEARHLMPVGEQPAGEVEADEAGGTGDEVMHAQAFAVRLPIGKWLKPYFSISSGL
jgi:hypothetical protein